VNKLIEEFELKSALYSRNKFLFLQPTDTKNIELMESFLSRVYGSESLFYSFSKFFSYPTEIEENELFSNLARKKDVLFVIETEDGRIFCCVTDQDCSAKNPVCGGKTMFINLSSGMTKDLSVGKQNNNYNTNCTKRYIQMTAMAMVKSILTTPTTEWHLFVLSVDRSDIKN
jgi:hypothetical protein